MLTFSSPFQNTNMISKQDFEAARQRDGSAADDRPEFVEDALSPDEKLGYGKELPLVGESYDEYPQGNEVLFPQNAEFVEELLNHDLVNSFDDAAAEIKGGKADVLEQAADLFDVDANDVFGGQRRGASDDTELERGEIRLFGETLDVDCFRDPIHQDSRLLSHLYVELGMSVEEIATYLQANSQGVSIDEHKVRRGLIDVGLVEGTRSGERTYVGSGNPVQ